MPDTTVEIFDNKNRATYGVALFDNGDGTYSHWPFDRPSDAGRVATATFDANPEEGDTFDIQGAVFTFADPGSGEYEVPIAVAFATTAANLRGRIMARGLDTHFVITDNGEGELTFTARVTGSYAQGLNLSAVSDHIEVADSTEGVTNRQDWAVKTAS